MIADSRVVYLFVYVTDLERSRAFYADTLGLEVIDEDEGSVMFDAGEVIFALNRAADYGIELPEDRDNSTDIVFLVDDLRAMQAALEARGVTFIPAVWYSVGGIADFYDPDGHWLTLYEPSKEAMTWPSGERIASVIQARKRRNGTGPKSSAATRAAGSDELTLAGSELIYIFFFVPDADEAEIFYNQQLGLRDLEGGPCSQETTDDEEGVIKYDTGGVLLTTHFFEPTRQPQEVEEHGCPPRDLDVERMKGAAPAFYVPDVQRVVNELKKRRPGFDPKVYRESVGVIARCEDPGGHMFFLYEPSREALATRPGRKIQEILATPL
jgi:catechol 2,3-dioxygenase-like lactoylglutathione lyase family enzyme